TSHTCTLAPSRTKARAASRPMPLAPAVTSTRSPRSPRSMPPPGNCVWTIALCRATVTVAEQCGKRRAPIARARSGLERRAGDRRGGRVVETDGREDIAMTHCSKLSRRVLLKGAAGSAVIAGIGMPAISRAQADVVRIGHLTPVTGFLGTLG